MHYWSVVNIKIGKVIFDQNGDPAPLINSIFNVIMIFMYVVLVSWMVKLFRNDLLYNKKILHIVTYFSAITNASTLAQLNFSAHTFFFLNKKMFLFAQRLCPNWVLCSFKHLNISTLIFVVENNTFTLV